MWIWVLPSTDPVCVSFNFITSLTRNAATASHHIHFQTIEAFQKGWPKMFMLRCILEIFFYAVVMCDEAELDRGGAADSPCSIPEAASAGTQPLCARRSSGWIHRLEWRRRWSRWHRGLRARSRAHYRENTATNTETLHLFWWMIKHWYDAALDWVRRLCFSERLLSWVITVHFYCMEKKQCLVFHRRKKVKNLV